MHLYINSFTLNGYRKRVFIKPPLLGERIEVSYTDVVGTTPWKGDDYKDVEGRERLEHVLEVELSQEQQSRATQERIYDHMEVGGRIESGTAIEDIFG